MILRRFKAMVVALAILGASMAVVPLTAPTTRAAGHANGCSSTFLTFPTWYDGLVNADCDIKQPGKNGAPELQGYILRIVLNILEIMLQLVAYATVGYIIYGGFKYLTSPSDSSKIAGGRKTIQNAIIGLVISFMSIAIVSLIGDNIIK